VEEAEEEVEEQEQLQSPHTPMEECKEYPRQYLMELVLTPKNSGLSFNDTNLSIAHMIV
jgi:hypothetical protein